MRVGETFSIRVKMLGAVHPIPPAGNYNNKKPRLRGPFNLNSSRQIQYHDNVLPEWTGCLTVDGEGVLAGPKKLKFDGSNQGVFPEDKRPIATFSGFSWRKPGIHFIRLTDPASGLCVSSNPVKVTAEEPASRLFWGDPHWQTFFSDGIRCPEEIYAFARDEGFLDFGAISDHMEAVTPRQWDYFQAVSNDYNVRGRFATLIGQEWTHHNKNMGAPGHRNIYVRGEKAPLLSSDDPKCNTLSKLWRQLDAVSRSTRVMAIPHHPANVVMGCNWDLGWNSKYEKAVEIYSVWGSSEKSGREGNTRPISMLKGEMDGQHVVDALKKGFRFGFVGGGDIHDGRPGDALHKFSYLAWSEAEREKVPGQGFTAVWTDKLTREKVFDAIWNRHCYATTQSRIYLEVSSQRKKRGLIIFRIEAASEQGIAEVVRVLNGNETRIENQCSDPRIFLSDPISIELDDNDFCYFRVMTQGGEMAWSSPVWGKAKK